MDLAKEEEGDDAPTSSTSLDDAAQNPVPKFTIQLDLGVSAPDLPYLSSSGFVQGSGSSFCRSTGNLGTLGVRVDRTPNTGFFYIATYHNFDKNGTLSSDFIWLYNVNGTPTVGQAGRVIDRKYQNGPTPVPFLDCALIQLDTVSQNQIAAGLLQGPDIHTSPLLVKGTNSAIVGQVVSKYGMTTGITYGLVINLPSNWDPSYAQHIFLVTLCDNHGITIPGNFSKPGDSGAPVVDQFGYVLGLVIQGFDSGGTSIGVINRINQVEAAFGVTVHTD